MPRERRFFFFLRCSLRASASSCGSGPLMSGLNIPKACSMALSMLSERLSRVEAYCPVDSGSGNSCGLLKRLFEGVGGKLLAQTGTVIYLTVSVVYEGHAVDTAFLVSLNTTSMPFSPSSRMKSSRFPRQPCMASVTASWIFGCHFRFLKSRTLTAILFFYPFVAEALADERRLDERAYRPARIVRQGIYDTVVG